jgi:hypothetical protein
MLDRDLAALYGVETKNLNKAVQRNLDRFSADFMFQLTLDEARACVPSRFQSGTLKRGHNIKYLPHVFTQEGRQRAVSRQKKVITPEAFQYDVFLGYISRARRWCARWQSGCGRTGLRVWLDEWVL